MFYSRVWWTEARLFKFWCLRPQVQLHAAHVVMRCTCTFLHATVPKSAHNQLSGWTESHFPVLYDRGNWFLHQYTRKTIWKRNPFQCSPLFRHTECTLLFAFHLLCCIYSTFSVHSPTDRHSHLLNISIPNNSAKDWNKILKYQLNCRPEFT